MNNQRGAAALAGAMMIAAIFAGLVMALTEFRRTLTEVSRSSRKNMAAHMIAVEAGSVLRGAYDYHNLFSGVCGGARNLRLVGGVGLCLPGNMQLTNPYMEGFPINLNDPAVANLVQFHPSHLKSKDAVVVRIKSTRQRNPLPWLQILPQAYAQAQDDRPVLGAVPSHAIAPPNPCPAAASCIRCAGPGQNADCVTLEFCVTPGDCGDNRFYKQVYGFLR